MKKSLWLIIVDEALIREWPTLRSWLEENREGLRLQRHLGLKI